MTTHATEPYFRIPYKKNEFVTWLNEEGLVLVWSIVGEKQFLRNHRGRTDHPNKLNISGLYTFKAGTLLDN